MSARWRQENYFKYAREHFALDALDSYADIADDPTRLVPNPAKAQAKAAVEAARAAPGPRRRTACPPRSTTPAAGPAAPAAAAPPPSTPPPTRHSPPPTTSSTGRRRTARDHPQPRPARPGPTRQPAAREQRKLLTHAIRMAPTTPNRPSPGCSARTTPEPRTKPAPCSAKPSPCSGDLQITGDTLHVRLDPATAPRRSRALHALCDQLTATETRYPGTDLKIAYSVKDQPEPS